jgi:hypothetical protein
MLDPNRMSGSSPFDRCDCDPSELDEQTFIARLQPIIDRQLEIYRNDPRDYISSIPLRIHRYFIERTPSRKISIACLLAESLIALHRRPSLPQFLCSTSLDL